MGAGDRAAVYDCKLGIEAYSFDGLAQPFPCHVHEYYVIGLVEGGERRLVCAGAEHSVSPGDVLLFNPGDGHACTQSGAALSYRALNIPREIMLMRTGREPRFAQSVVHCEAVASELRSLHADVMSAEPGREERLDKLLNRLADIYGGKADGRLHRAEVERACEYIRAHYAGHITAAALAAEAGLSESALLRAFTKAMGVTPYRYLESVRVGAALRLLERGVPAAEAAQLCGFSDQSHLTRSFGRFLGLTPGMYREIYGKEGDSSGS